MEKDKRQDIYTLANAYLGQLKMRKSHMVDEAKFHLKDVSTGGDNVRADAKGSGTSLKQSSSKLATVAGESKFKQPSKTSSSEKPSAQQTNGTSSGKQLVNGQANGAHNGLANASSNVAHSATASSTSVIQQASQSKSLDLTSPVGSKEVASTKTSSSK